MLRGARVIFSPAYLYAIPLVVLVLIVCQFVGCPRFTPGEPDATVDEPTPLRPVRVLLGTGLTTLRFRSEQAVSLRGAAGRASGSCRKQAWHIVDIGADGHPRIDGRPREAAAIELTSGWAGAIRVSLPDGDDWREPRGYAGRLRITASDEGELDLINLVDVDRYVASVVAHEVWPTFATEAYRAQAIVARTYVVYQMQRRSSARYDVRATQRSQVYAGVRNDVVGRRATEATRYTAGLVCTWRDHGEDRLFSTYYSAACGGMSQSASIFGAADDVPPLRGGVRCDYCRIAPGESYRWGPVRMDSDDVLDRLAARYPEFADLDGIASIEVIERTVGDRPVRLRIDGLNGESRQIGAERFRLALGASTIRSTAFDIRATTGEVVFENGRGFGHGLGLCQWGMQGQAAAGRSAGEILKYYYPGCHIARVY